MVNADTTLGDLLQRESRPHPASAAKKPKKVRQSKQGHLKGIAAGQLLTQPHIIQGIKEHEQREREAAQRKETEKFALLELRKQQKADAAAAKKRKRAEGSASARQAKRTPQAPSQEKEEGKEEVSPPETSQARL